MKKALIIDDSRISRLLLKKILTSIGFTVAEADNGRTGLEALAREGELAVALVDHVMPEMDGVEFVRTVRARPEYAHLPLVMVTAAEQPADLQDALAAGVSGYVTKPFSGDSILCKLQSLGIMAV